VNEQKIYIYSVRGYSVSYVSWLHLDIFFTNVMLTFVTDMFWLFKCDNVLLLRKC